MTSQPLVGIAMGSSSDLPTLQPAIDILQELGVPCEVRVLSAHRTPERMTEYARTAHERGLKAIIAGAGGAAHLPGMIAASTPLPVIGVPVDTASATLGGIDALLSIVQMPRGVPVATVAIGGGQNAGILAAQICAAADPALLDRLIAYKHSLTEKVLQQDQDVQEP
ncbi:MAG: 5-(carboxyamino)imidazole ribonucleotide mutase [Sphaerobacteraceae bacterium]|nr:MAG: 5-(carboxyamino)imidazole ribonucleotide mutase [Sphaerobacteraceae bacterium]